MKPVAIGKAARWQGYVARLGFGITRTRNQASAKAPPIGKYQRDDRHVAGLRVDGSLTRVGACPYC